MNNSDSFHVREQAKLFSIAALALPTTGRLACWPAAAVLAGAHRLAAVVAVVALSISPLLADTPKWGAHLDFEGRWGNIRSLGDAGLFAPLWQDPNTLFFADIRGRLDSQDGREGNFGLGIRRMFNNGWNLGAYGYYDARRTALGNMFNQVTLGVEALSVDFDIRANLYAPFGDTSRQIGTTGGGAPFAELANGTIQVVTPGIGQIVERAMTGFDGEIGWRAPVFDVEALTQVRVYGGGYYFSGGGVTKDIAGPRGRIEFSLDDLAGFSAARLTFGAEVQHDDARGTQGFAIARLRVPLQVDRPAARLTAQERRMTERVVRDVDIVSGTGRGAQLRAEVREAAVNTWNNQAVTTATQVDASTEAALQAALNAQGAGSVVILNGTITGVTTGTSVNANQTLIGGGTALAVKGATTGMAANFVAPGAAGVISGHASAGGLGEGIIRVGAGSVVGGLTVANSSTGAGDEHGIFGDGANGAAVFGNSITTGEFAVGVMFLRSDNSQAMGNRIASSGEGGVGVQFLDSNNGRVIGNQITRSGDQGAGIAITNSRTAYVRGNNITTSGTDALGIYLWDASAVVTDNIFGPIGGAAILPGDRSSFMSGSTGNVLNGPANQRCSSIGPASSGTVYFTDGINCVYP